MLTSGVVLGGLLGLAAAQFPAEPKGVTVLKSKFHENVTISFKEPHICEETPNVKSYSGYVHLPPGFLDDANGEQQDYPVNTFFWFIEARKDPANAPLAIWLNGGPGGSSMMGMLQENGPCLINADSKTSRLNPWSWNNEVNMLYIDEPTQVGFSYDVPTNCTLKYVTPEDSIGAGMDELPGPRPADFTESGVPETNNTFRVGTFSSQDVKKTTNSTAQAAHALWHFAQTFFFEFPAYKPHDDRISLWAESYGGHYGPGFMRFFQEQNEKIDNGTIEVDHAHYMHLDTLGIVNGLLDIVIQEEAYISFPFNNTYGLQIFNESLYTELRHNFTRPDGCRDQLIACQARLRAHDDLVSIADVCTMDPWCEEPAVQAFQTLDSGWFDIAHPGNDPFPEPHMHGYLMQEEILEALGTPVNFTAGSSAVATAFRSSRDLIRGGFLDSVGYLLDSGVKVHMMYGDRDYACNWVGGEAASLAIPYARSGDFATAGYAPLVTSEGGVKGVTRQHGNFSFSRVFQAGHEVPSYQSAAAYDIFMRATFNRDIPTGLLPVSDDFATAGLSDSWHIKNNPPARPEPQCYVLSPDRCVPEVWEQVKSGAAIVKDYFVVGSEKEEEEVLGNGEL